MSNEVEIEGSNHYKIPHMGKVALQHRGELPHTLRGSPEIARNAREFVGDNTPIHCQDKWHT